MLLRRLVVHGDVTLHPSRVFRRRDDWKPPLPKQASPLFCQMEKVSEISGRSRLSIAC